MPGWHFCRFLKIFLFRSTLICSYGQDAVLVGFVVWCLRYWQFLDVLLVTASLFGTSPLMSHLSPLSALRHSCNLIRHVLRPSLWSFIALCLCKCCLVCIQGIHFFESWAQWVTTADWQACVLLYRRGYDDLQTHAQWRVHYFTLFFFY